MANGLKRGLLIRLDSLDGQSTVLVAVMELPFCCLGS